MEQKMPISPDTTIYIVCGSGPLWYSAADSPEQAVARAIAGSEWASGSDPFEVHKVKAQTLFRREESLGGLLRAVQEGTEVQSYDHQKALAMSRAMNKSMANQRREALEAALYETDREKDERLQEESQNGQQPTRATGELREFSSGVQLTRRMLLEMKKHLSTRRIAEIIGVSYLEVQGVIGGSGSGDDPGLGL